jgi:hypothetical protein
VTHVSGASLAASAATKIFVTCSALCDVLHLCSGRFKVATRFALNVAKRDGTRWRNGGRIKQDNGNDD